MTSDNAYFFPGGPAGVLLIHGLGGTPVEIKKVGKSLARAGYTVYGMQLAGHCGTEADLVATRWQDWYASVEAAHTRLARQCRTVFAAGLSMGAVLALHLAAQRPAAVAGVGIYSITLKCDGWSISKLNFLLPLVLSLPWGRNHGFCESHPYGIKDERLRRVVVRKMEEGASADAGLLRTPGVSIRELQRLVTVVKREMPRIRTPALVLHATEDDVASVRTNAHYLKRYLGGPVELVLLDDCYHIITVDRQRHEVINHSLRFFNSLVSQADIPMRGQDRAMAVTRPVADEMAEVCTTEA